MIEVGGQIPDVELFQDTPKHGVKLFKHIEGKRVLIVGVVGAFMPICTELHLSGYIKNAAKIREKLNVAEIICIAVNDPFVMAAWGREQSASDVMTFLADTKAEFVKATGLEIQLPALGGVRSKRFNMIVNNGIVEKINVEADGTGLNCTLADKLCPTEEPKENEPTPQS